VVKKLKIEEIKYMAIKDILIDEQLKTAWVNFRAALRNFKKCSLYLQEAIVALKACTNYSAMASVAEKSKVSSVKDYLATLTIPDDTGNGF
jgi:hypothetical protein